MLNNEHLLPSHILINCSSCCELLLLRVHFLVVVYWYTLLLLFTCTQVWPVPERRGAEHALVWTCARGCTHSLWGAAHLGGKVCVLQHTVHFSEVVLQPSTLWSLCLTIELDVTVVCVVRQ